MIQKMPDILWRPLAAAILIFCAGATGFAAGTPWLFPSLGPTVFIQVSEPDHPTAKFYNVVVGHALGLASGAAGVITLGLQDAVPITAGVLTAERVVAGTIAVALTAAAETLLRAPHPSAMATSLIIALGVLPLSWNTALTIGVGVLIIAVLGEGLRRVRLKL